MPPSSGVSRPGTDRYFVILRVARRASSIELRFLWSPLFDVLQRTGNGVFRPHTTFGFWRYAFAFLPSTMGRVATGIDIKSYLFRSAPTVALSQVAPAGSPRTAVISFLCSEQMLTPHRIHTPCRWFYKRKIIKTQIRNVSLVITEQSCFSTHCFIPVVI